MFTTNQERKRKRSKHSLGTDLWKTMENRGKPGTDGTFTVPERILASECILPSLRDLGCVVAASPALKHWAIIDRPSGTLSLPTVEPGL